MLCSKFIATKGAWVLTFLLMGTATLAYIDRQIFNLFAEAIKGDLGLTDTELGILQGLAFSLFYGTVSLPLARLADRYSRKKLIGACILFWSLVAAATGASKSFLSMFLCRAGVASGEAGLAPTAASMFPDVFPKSKLALPLGIYTMSIYIGSSLAFAIGALVQSAFGSVNVVDVPLLGEISVWRVAFIIVGAIGLPWLLVMWKFLQDPTRMAYTPDGTAVAVTHSQSSVGEVLAYLRGNLGFYAAFFIGFTLALGCANAVFSWSPAILIRVFEAPVTEVGHLYGITFLAAGVLGANVLGWVATRLVEAGRKDGLLLVSMASLIGLVVSQIIFSNADRMIVALVAAGASIFFIAPLISLPPAIIQSVSPSNMRAQLSAAFLMVTGVLGLGLGPIIVGLVTDYVFVDPMRLHHAVATATIVMCAMAFPLLYATRRHFIKLEQ